MDEPLITIDLTPGGTLRRLERFVWFTDLALPVPGTRRSIGVDAMLSLIPGIGSIIGTGLSLYLVAEAARHGAPAKLLGRMGTNIAVDTLLGAIPVAGFFFDLVFRANDRNMRLLREHLEEVAR
jgi:hypothetical protein